jgi:hypothetical protein
MIGGVVGLLNVGPGAGVPKVGPGAGLGLRNCAFAGPATAIKAAIRTVRLIKDLHKSPPWFYNVASAVGDCKARSDTAAAPITMKAGLIAFPVR